MREIGALARTVHALSESVFRKYRLQKGQFLFLTRICENPGIGLMELSVLLRGDKTTTTKAVQKLVDEGYVTKTGDGEDRRRSCLFPTEKASGVYEAVINEENKNIDICFRDFSEAERQTVLSLIVRMKENVEADWREVKNYRE